ncbi:MAG: hypothetical protein AAGE52_05820 [Myxococcota bacterium]
MNRSIFVPLLLWMAASAVVALSGVLTMERRGLVPLSILGASLALVFLYWKRTRFREQVDAIDVRWWLGLHVLRAPIGAAFLWMEAHGGLPSLFAQRAGWGDLVAGAGAFGLLFGGAWLRTPRGQQVAWIWNLVGFLDIAVVVGTAQYLLFVAGDEGMLVLTNFPWAMLPTFLVPLVITTHLLLFRRWKIKFYNVKLTS